MNNPEKAPAAGTPTWFRMEIDMGLERMRKARLHFCPQSVEEMDATREEWIAIIWPGKKWEAHLDTPRIRGTFHRLLSECSNFPAPQEFLERLALKHREPKKQLEDPEKNILSAELAATRFRQITHYVKTGEKPKFMSRNDKPTGEG